MIGEKSSRRKLSAACGADGFVERMWERHAVKKLWAKDLMDETTNAVSWGKAVQKSDRAGGA